MGYSSRAYERSKRKSCVSIPLPSSSLLKSLHHKGLTWPHASLYKHRVTLAFVMSMPQPTQYDTIFYFVMIHKRKLLYNYIPVIHMLSARVTRHLDQRARSNPRVGQTTTPVHRKLRYVSKRNKLVQLVVQVKYHVNVIYSLGGRHTQTSMSRTKAISRN